ncbi:MAG: MFS transporter [Chloroflexi bacterium]|nr:MFS transporter [Chloroflexota bacterium]
MPLEFVVSFGLLKFNQNPEAATPSPLPGPTEPIFTRNFVCDALANLFTFASFHVLLATLPIYVVQIGGRQSEVGLVIAAFAVTSLATRPFAGQATDIWGRKRLMVLGGLGMGLSPLLYIVSTSVLPLIGARLVQGIAFGVMGTATAALLADVVPASRRGEAVGYFGMSNNLAMAAGPALGIVILQGLGFTNLFLVSAGIGSLAFVFALLVREPPRQSRPNSPKRSPLVVRAALFPASMMFFYALTFGGVVTFLPLFAVSRGLGNPGLFFTVQATVVMALRGFTGKLSDRFGRGAVALPGMVALAISLVLLSRASSVPAFLTTAALYAVAFSCIQPSMTALVMDRVKPEMRGAAMGTFISSMDAGIGSGALLWGVVSGLTGYSHMYLIATSVPVIAIGLYMWATRGKLEVGNQK